MKPLSSIGSLLTTRRGKRAGPRRLGAGLGLGLAGVLFLGVTGCGGREPAGSAPAEPAPAESPDARAEGTAARHLLLVTLDTLRADHLGIYGSDVPTPHLDALAAAGAWVEEASTHVPLTRPAHVSMMTGLLPHRTGVRDNISPVPIPDVPMLAEVLAEDGFATAAFVSAAVVGRESGLGRGFGLFDDNFAGAKGTTFLGRAQRRGDQTLAEAITWLEAHRHEPRWFLWLHLYDPHDPYEAPEPWASRFPRRPYAAEVAWTDELVGRLLESLGQLGLREETLTVVTSDHGEGLGEHDEQLHGFFAYQSTLRVPLLFQGPGVTAGGHLSGPVGLVDLFPTILDLLGSSAPAGAAESGRSLAGALGSGESLPKVPVMAESLVARLHFGWSELRTLRQDQWKYIQAPRPELYDLENDPGELRNLAAEERSRLRDMRDDLAALLVDEVQIEGGEAASPEWLEQMAALGYLGSAGPAETSTPGADPKDKIAEFRQANDLMRRGLEHLGREEMAESAARFEELITLGIANGEIYLYLGKAQLGSGRPEDAVESFLEATARVPARAEGWLGLAEAKARIGELEGALDVLRASHGPLPDHPGLYREEGRLLRRLGRLEEARLALETSRSAGPADPWVHLALGELTRDLGDAESAVSLLEKATELAPEDAAAWNALGMTLGGLGEMPRAEEAFRQAHELAGEHHLYAYNLGLALQRLGQGKEAAGLFTKTLTLEPRFQAARDRLAELGR